MKSIRFFITSLGGGGAEKVLTNLLSALDPLRYNITLVSIEGGVNEKYIPAAVKHRVILRLRNAAIRKFISKVIQKLPPALFAVIFLRGNYDYEVAYLEGRPTRFVAAKRTKAKKYAFVHCDFTKQGTALSIYRGKENCLNNYKSFDRVCFVSEEVIRGFESAVGKLDNACVIHNVINSREIIEAAKTQCETEYCTKGVKLITIGRLVKEKNYAMLLEVISELEKDYSFELWILGEGELKNSLLQQIKQKNIRSVRLLGFQSNPYPYIKKADCMVCSSLYEGYSTAVKEAVILGIPVITTNCAGMAEILHIGEFGVITENSKDGLKNGLTELLSDPEKLSQYRANISNCNSIDIGIKENNALFEQ